jgi:archaeal flagellin FlaB
MYKTLFKNDKGFTGLEAAIVLIAFVVVAAVFSYVMLGAGFFTTQKSQEVVHTGVSQASSSLEPSGDVIVRGKTGGGSADQVTFYIENTAGETPVDLSKTVISYTDSNDYASEAYTSSTGDWDYYPVVKSSTSRNLVESGDKYKIIVDLVANNTRNSLNSLDPNGAPTVNEQIKIQVKPPTGAVLTIIKTMPPALIAGDYYPVY